MTHGDNPSAHRVSRILAGAANLSREEELERLVPVVYEELRELAAARLRGERPDHSLQPTDEALRRLEERDPRSAEVVQLRYFGGFSVPETAEALGISERTVNREWTFARAWLRAALERGEG